mmetsp:Transcript_37740/g.108790  ORF Transcript_37740/g.108790 Transcript_37740/m.108790 type:complete len:567 (+) Transcript_37740:1-1701(+)
MDFSKSPPAPPGPMAGTAAGSAKATGRLRDVVLLFGAATLVKVLLVGCYRSTDFEVHRNWLAIAHSLPLSKWYYEATSEWTLDYPPFFAYFEWLLSQGARLADPGMLEVSNLNYASRATVLYQRGTVMLSDVLLLAGTWLWARGRPAKDAAVVAGLTLLNPGLLMVDHIHFQYNGSMLGVLVASLALAREGRDAPAALLFACLLMLKHIFAYIVPVYFVYLLRHHCWPARGAGEHVAASWLPTGGFKLGAFLQLAAAALAVLAAAFGPLLAAAWREGGPGAAVAYALQIKGRLFPFQRGLCHAYWAPNAWALYNVADKALLHALRRLPGFGRVVEDGSRASMTGGLVEVASHAVLPNILAPHTFALTLLAMAPVLAATWRRPRPRAFVHAVVYCQLCSFMLGYHVHEKAILTAVVPLGLVCLDTALDAKIYLLVSWVGHYSLFPLLFEAREEPIKVIFFLLHVVASFWLLDRHHRLRQQEAKTQPVGVAFALPEKLYLAGLAPLYIFTNLLHPVLFKARDGSIRLPFLPLLLTSVYCALGLAYAWALALARCLREPAEQGQGRKEE